MIREADAEAALALLRDEGLRVEVPPEGWLVKAWGKAGLHRIGGDRLALPITNLYRRLVRGQAPLRY